MIRSENNVNGLWTQQHLTTRCQKILLDELLVKADAFRSEILRNQSSWAIKRRLILWLTNLRSDVWGKKRREKAEAPTSTWTGFCTLHLIHQMAYSGHGVSLKLSKSAHADFTNQRRFVSRRVVFTYPKIQRLKLCTQGSSRYIYIYIIIHIYNIHMIQHDPRFA